MQNGWTNYDNGDHSNNNHNTIVEKTVVDEWSHLFRLFTSVHALRRSNARAVHLDSALAQYHWKWRTWKETNGMKILFAWNQYMLWRCLILMKRNPT